jgi:hypothetical protein
MNKYVLIPPRKGFLHPAMLRFSFEEFHNILEKCILIEVAVIVLPLLDWAEEEVCLEVILLVNE